MAGFVGRYEHSLDTKGRVILPAKFRGQFERGGYLTQNSEGCLALWTPGEFERQMDAMQEKTDSGRADRNRARIWAANSAEVEIDRQGRMPIPVHLRTFAGSRRRGAGARSHRSGGAVESGGVGRASAARGELAAGRRGLRTTAATGTAVTGRQQQEARERTQPQNPERRQERTTRGTHWTMCSSSIGALEGHSTHLHVGRTDLHPYSTHRSGGCRWPIRSNTFPCCATKWSRCSHPCPPGWWSTRPSAAAVTPRRYSRRTQACVLSGWIAIRPLWRRLVSGCPLSGTASRSLPPRSPRWSLFSPSRIRAPRGCSPRPGRQLPATRLVRAWLLIP